MQLVVAKITRRLAYRLSQRNVFYLKTHGVPRSKHSVSVIKTSQLMLYREIIAVCSQIHTKHINTLCGQNVEFLSLKLGITNRNQALEC